MQNHLATMGITVWQRRALHQPDNVPEPTPAPRFVFVAESSQADQSLLNNIIKALECPPEAAYIIWVNNPTDLSQQIWPSAPVIVFGEALYPYVPQSAIRSLALNALAQNLPAKKTLWQTLKNLP